MAQTTAASWQDWPSFVVPEIDDYITSVSVRENPIQARLRDVTRAKVARHMNMQISADEGQFLALMVQLIGARKCIEIGTFTGYSAMAVALALPPDGKLIACDVSAEWTAIGKPFWREAGVADKIELRLAPANETLDKMLANGEHGTYDFVFIDADKTEYDSYYERLIKLVRVGGLMVFDNVLRAGRVLDKNAQDPGTVAVRALNRKLHADERISLSMLPLRDGVTLACKR